MSPHQENHSEQSRAQDIILLVDSDMIERSKIAEYLRECGYRVMEATLMSEAVELIEHQKIDLAVTDAELRDASGFSFSAWIRANRPEIKVVVTASTEKTANLAGELCEQGPLLKKPYHPQLLVEHIRRLRGS